MTSQPETSAVASPRPSLPRDIPISVILTVLNEERHVAEAVRRALLQDHPGQIEVLVALGPSTDRTDEIVEKIAADDERVRWVRNPDPRGSTPAGLNAALAASRHPVVARIDGHALLPADYLRIAVETLNRSGADNVGGMMAAEGITTFEQAVAAAMTSRLGVGSAAFHTGGEEGASDTVYLGVFRRTALERVGGYDEAFLRAQDWEMNLRIRRTGGAVWFQPALQVAYRPRSSVGALARQYFHYGRWRRVVMRRHEGTASLRYLAAPVAVVGIALGLILAPLGVFWPALAAAIMLPIGYLVAVVVAGVGVVGRGLPLGLRLRLPGVLATMHLSWGLGFLTSPKDLAANSPSL
jgi:succinoglycan biosynthesis protein ExoA